MKYHLFLFTFIFFSCASQGYPTGGPIDDIGPKMIKSEPNSKSRLSKDDKIVIFFDELINPISVVNAINIFPFHDFSYKVLGKKIIITPNDGWISSGVVKVTLSRTIADYQNNLMKAPLNLFYFNSNKISNKSIVGTIIDANDQLFELGLYRIDNSDYTLIEKTQSDENSNFIFNYLDAGNYFVIAVKDSLTNIENDIRDRRYGMINESYIDLINNDTINSIIKVDSPIERLSIQSFEQINNSFGYLIYNNGKKQTFIIPDFQDSLFININLSNRLESYKITNHLILLTNMLDTLLPEIQSFNMSDNIYNVNFSEPIKLSEIQYKPTIFYLKDSVYHNIGYNVVNPYSISFDLDDVSSDFFITNIIDLYDNTILDTLPLLLSSDNMLYNNRDLGNGNVYGSIIYDGKWPIIIEAKDTELSNAYYSLLNDDNTFSIMGIEPGFYSFSAFEFFGGYDSTQYFSGTWFPFHRAAKFGNYPNNLEIRKYWDIEDMIIEVK